MRLKQYQVLAALPILVWDPPTPYFSILLSVREAARTLGVSERHLRAHLHEVPHARIGGRVIIPVAALLGWLDEQVQLGANRADDIVDEIVRSLSDDQR